jgi:hypothetical protein
MAKHLLPVTMWLLASCTGEFQGTDKSQVVNAAGQVDPAAWDALCTNRGAPPGCDAHGNLVLAVGGKPSA